ncbi:hypothetical protein WOLCODRAFT_140999 [Wolfiporia cocos MD-104 SS10]|uniref:DNA replication regulator Sld3 C-terminal domain-containing protein n=1 Tax=Wolfiporia cocos (strain MD-104) TaxID=742152 RepID=A0A2H3JQI9_WOLCO|nr:hypothetical protein WOLCODRAFT_140999 [Wolfiporia cocos MD-104 SS10]
MYQLSNQCPVRWTATQEKTISRDYPLSLGIAKTLDEHVWRTYLQFLWLPESVVPLRLLIPSLSRFLRTTTLPASSLHPPHSCVRPLLLTPRSAAQKYHDHINQIVDNDGGPSDAEEHMMWYAYKNERMGAADAQDGSEDAYAAEERWKNAWLARMERREVQIQILLHLLVLSLSGAVRDAQPEKDELPLHLSPSKKRKRKQAEAAAAHRTLSLEEVLESFMDKLSMWQLVASLDADDTHPRRNNTRDERDWMQAFCEDVVEVQFKATLPEQCALLRSKVFPTSPFSDTDSDASLSPPTRPKTLLAPSHTRPSPAPHASQPSASASSHSARTRSLSISLSEERARSRSRSLGVGPQVHKRALAREVSMTTALGAKARQQAASKQAAEKRASKQADARRTREKERESARDGARAAAQGVTLVAATPVKPKRARAGRGTSSVEAARDESLPPLPRCDFGVGAGQGGEEEDDEEDNGNLTLPSSPDVMLLSSSSRGPSSAASGADSDSDSNDGRGVESFSGMGRAFRVTQK